MRLEKISPLLIALIVMVCLPAIGSAALQNVVVLTNTATLYSATIDWTQNSPDPASLSSIGGTTFWNVSILAASNSGELEVTNAQHRVPTFGPTLNVMLNGVFAGCCSTAVSGMDQAIHGPVVGGFADIDKLDVSILKVNSTTSRISITAEHLVHQHVPEPTNAAIWLFSGGSLFFAARRRFRRV